MIPGEVYTQSQIDKLGNAIVYLCKKMPERLTKTHILKLVFIIEELSVKRFGVPFFNLNFYVWQLGPVAKDLFVELSEGEQTFLLSNYITKEVQANAIFIYPIAEFKDDEFNDLEIELLEQVVDRFKYCTAGELVNFTHRKNSPWYNAAQKNGVLDLLENKQMTTTEIKIDLAELIQDDKDKSALYHANHEFLSQARTLKF